MNVAPLAHSPPLPYVGTLKAFYFLYFVAVGFYYPFIVPYFRGLGLTGSEIGTAQAIAAVAAVPASLLWGALADRLRASAASLRLATRGALAVATMLLFARTPSAIALVLFAHGLVVPAVIPLLDTVTVESIRGRAGASYARVRVFGSLGFIAAALGFGILLSFRGGGAIDRSVPWAYACAFLAFAVAASVLPIAPRGEWPRPHIGQMLALVRDRRLLLLLAAGAVHSASTSSYQLFGVLVHDQGLSPAVTGAGMAFGVAAEVLVLFLFPWLERRFSVSALLVFAFVGSALRWSLLARSHGAAALIGIQAAHGLTFGLYWAASVSALVALVPPPLRATGQAIYSAVTFSIGGAVGYRMAGFGYDLLGGAGPVFHWAAAAELVAVALAFSLGRAFRRHPR